MDCSAARKLISDHLGSELLPEEQALLEGHLTSCTACSAYLIDMIEMLAALGSLDEVEPPAWLTAKVMGKIRQELPHKKRWYETLFFPLHIKLPLEALGMVLIAGFAVLIMRSVQPDLTLMTKQPAPQPKRTVVPGKAADAPSPAGRRGDTAVQEQPGSLSSALQQPAEKDQAPPPAEKRDEPALQKETADTLNAADAVRRPDQRSAAESMPPAAPAPPQYASTAEKKAAAPGSIIRLHAKDTEAAYRQIQEVLLRIKAEVKSVDRQAHSLIITARITPEKTEEFLKQAARIGSVKEEPGSERREEDTLRIVIEP